MKSQTSSSKPQRSLKLQTANLRETSSNETPSCKAQTAGKSQSQPSNGERPPPDTETWTLNEPTANDSASRHPFDLEERTAKFGEAIIRFAKKIPRGPGNDRLIDQLVG